MKLDIKTIAKNLTIKTNKGFNTDLFKSDTEIIEDSIDNYLTECDYYVSIDFETTTDNITKQVNGTKETFLTMLKGDIYLITAIEKKGYNGNIEETIYSKWLTLQGFNYFAKKSLQDPNQTEEDIQDLKDIINIYYQNMILESFGFEVDINDLFSIAEDKENYLQVKFIYDFIEYKINFNHLGLITSYSKNDIDNKEEIKTTFKRRGSKC